jgi:hypothetical protein
MGWCWLVILLVWSPVLLVLSVLLVLRVLPDELVLSG